jgi:acyl-coenzyme A thioesterase PaaI-like protein
MQAIHQYMYVHFGPASSGSQSSEPPKRQEGVEVGEPIRMSITNDVESVDEQLHARPHSACFVCGQDNPNGLRIPFERQANGAMTAAWTPGSSWEGFRGIVHGGVVSTVLDEAMSKAVAASGTEALTAELRVRYRLPVQSGAAFVIRGWIVSRRKRLIEAEATLVSPDDTEHAHAWASFLTLP